MGRKWKKESNMDAKFKILIENLNMTCKYWDVHNEECGRFSGELIIGDISYQEDPPTNCSGKIQKCERVLQDLIRDPKD